LLCGLVTVRIVNPLRLATSVVELNSVFSWSAREIDRVNDNLYDDQPAGKFSLADQQGMTLALVIDDSDGTLRAVDIGHYGDWWLYRKGLRL
jgi:hypothetical protein